jgi:tetratricopeptide (TPR) repeat protein
VTELGKAVFLSYASQDANAAAQICAALRAAGTTHLPGGKASPAFIERVMGLLAPEERAASAGGRAATATPPEIRAAADFIKALALDPSDSTVLVRYGGLLSALGRLPEAEESQRVLEDLVKNHGPDSPYMIAEVHAWRGDKEQAFAWLERAYARHAIEFFNLKSEPKFSSLLDDPRYHALLRKLNLPE